MKKAFRHYSLPSVYKEADWPLKTIRNTLQYADVISANVQELYNLIRDQEYGLLQYEHDSQTSNIPDSFVEIIKATYEEGIALHKLFDPEFLEIKQSHLTEHERAALEKKFPSEDERAGHLHVAELLRVMRHQSSQALLREEGLISDADYQATLEETDAMLAARGHYGIYRLVMAQPTLKEKLDTSRKAIVVPFSKGVETFDEPSLSNFTVAAYLNSERAYYEELSKNKTDNPTEFVEKAMEQAYAICGGETFANAFEAKCGAISGLTWSRTPIEKDFPLTLSDIAKRSPGELFQLGHKRVKLSEAYAIKHAAGLMDPKTAAALEAAGKINLANAQVIDSGFHSHMGKGIYAKHISDMYIRAYERENPQAAQGAHIVESDSQQLTNDQTPLSIGHDKGDDTREADADAQKKTPGQNASETDSDLSSEENNREPSDGGKDKAAAPAAAASESSKDGADTALAIKAGGALLGSLVAIDQVRRANKQDDKREDGTSKSNSGTMHYVIAAAAALGVGALLLTSKQSIGKIFGKGQGKA